ncbi:hypothetical protein C8R44DRAFT_875712 [Mycena epipterygia]|nr:hypothetical protein C8R44DRAFT_875712 [Mycena epipterygia]
MPQLDIRNLAPGEPAIVQDDPWQEVAPQTDNAPQQVQSVAPPSTTSFEFSPSISSSAILSTASPISSLLSSTISAASSSLPISSSLVPSSSPTSSWSSITPSSLSSSTSSSSSPAASPAALHHPSASTSPAALRRPSTLTHGAHLYAALALGAHILLASLTALTAFLIRAAALTSIGWDPGILADAKPYVSNNNGNSDDNSNEFAGDRDVGEPKRSETFVSRRVSSASTQTRSTARDTYYAPHPHSQLADSTAYSLLPLMPASVLAVESRNSERGPYPTTRPLPAYLADRNPYWLSIDNANINNHDTNSRRITTRSVTSSRTGSLRSRLQSASMLGRCVSVHSAPAPASMEVAKYSSTADSTSMFTAPVL